MNNKLKEFGTDLYNSKFNLVLENGYIYFNLDVSKKDIEFEYRLYDDSTLVETIFYSKNKNIKFKLNKFGKYRVKVFIKDINKRKEDYSFLTGFITFNTESALNKLNPKNNTFEDSLNRINSFIKEEKDKETRINNLVEKLEAIASMDYNIAKYFKDKNINSINIYTSKDEVKLAKLLWISARYQKKFNTKYLLSDSTFTDSVTMPRKVPLTFSKVSDDMIFTKKDIIVIASSYKDKNIIDNLSKTGASILSLTDIISEILITKFIKEPLINIKDKNPGINLLVGILPTLDKVKNLSNNEQELIKNNVILKNVRDEFKKSNPNIPESLKVFEESLEYNKEVMDLYYFMDKDGIQLTKDLSKENVNVVNNFRLTTDMPDTFDNTIYIFGNSIVFGIGADDKNTIPSYVQRLVNNSDKKYSVLNCANHAASDYDYQFDLINSMDFKDGDIIISLLHLNPGVSDSYNYINMSNVFDRPHALGEIFIDRTHINKVGNETIAKSLYNALESNNLFDTNKKVVKKTTKLADKIIPKDEMPELTEYKNLLLKNKSKTKGKSIGSIVMNCNPFTLGHYYLIESSAKKVDHLYIFAVEEDKSFFPFEDRFKLMVEGTKDLPNVTVIPSGKFIISSLTFSDYFNKEKLSTETINMSDDVTIFAEEIAPTLNINKRFVGEEPLCNVTRQYNATLNRILPKYGITLEIVKRKEEGSEPISASRVRRLLKDKNFDEISTIVPKTTLDYLLKRFN